MCNSSCLKMLPVEMKTYNFNKYANCRNKTIPQLNSSTVFKLPPV